MKKQDENNGQFVICERFDNLGMQDPSRTYKLGVMGGSFDPIHLGHLVCAEQAREHANLDAVIFVPAGNHVFKKGSVVASAHHRYNMCKAACETNKFFDASPIEIQSENESYTINMLKFLRRHYPENVELYFIAGQDVVLDILKWKDTEEIGKLATFIVATRPGYSISEDRRAAISAESNIKMEFCEVAAMEISSSALRKTISKGRSLRYLTTLNVCNYIKEFNLYE